MVRIPKITSVVNALRIYYENTDIGNKEIMELFSVGVNTAMALKKVAKDQQMKDDVPCYNASRVNTESAYKAWGLSVENLEHRMIKLNKLLPETR